MRPQDEATCILYVLLDILARSFAEYFYELCRILSISQGKSKQETTSENNQQYYTSKRLTSDLLFNCFIPYAFLIKWEKLSKQRRVPCAAD